MADYPTPTFQPQCSVLDGSELIKSGGCGLGVGPAYNSHKELFRFAQFILSKTFKLAKAHQVFFWSIRHSSILCAKFAVTVVSREDMRFDQCFALCIPQFLS